MRVYDRTGRIYEWTGLYGLHPGLRDTRVITRTILGNPGQLVTPNYDDDDDKSTTQNYAAITMEIGTNPGILEF